LAGGQRVKGRRGAVEFVAEFPKKKFDTKFAEKWVIKSRSAVKEPVRAD
jgi:hypothetical protein